MASQETRYQVAQTVSFTLAFLGIINGYGAWALLDVEGDWLFGVVSIEKGNLTMFAVLMLVNLAVMTVGSFWVWHQSPRPKMTFKEPGSEN